MKLVVTLPLQPPGKILARDEAEFVGEVDISIRALMSGQSVASCVEDITSQCRRGCYAYDRC